MRNEQMTNCDCRSASVTMTNRRDHSVLGTQYSALAIMAMLAILAPLSGCTVNDATPAPPATVRGNFFPFDNGLLYSYRRFNNNRYDTLNLLLNIGQPPSTSNTLIDAATKLPYYYIGFAFDADNNLAAML